MGDMGNIFNLMREHGREKRASNRKSSVKMLMEAGIEFRLLNNGAHVQINNPHGKGAIDYWPGTGKWIAGQTSRRGVRSLLQYLQGGGHD